MKIKYYWWLLLTLQPLLYAVFTPLNVFNLYIEFIFYGSLILSWASAITLLYCYGSNKRNIPKSKGSVLLIFVSAALIIGIIGYPTSFGGYFLFPFLYISLLCFVVILIFTAKKLVFIPNENKS